METSVYPVFSVYRDYLARNRASPETVNCFASATKAYVRHFGEVLPADQASVMQFRAEAPVTYFRYLRSAFERAKEIGTVSENPFFRCPKPARLEANRTESQRPPKFLTGEQVQRLLSALVKRGNDMPFLRFVRCALATGFRAEELVSLQVQDCLEDRIVCKRGKGAHEWNPKSRVVPVDPRVCAYLRHGRQNPEEPLLVNRNGMRWDLRAVRRHSKKWLRRIGLERDAYVNPIHIYRHTAATQWLTEGATVAQVQKWLGHSDLRMTCIYLHAVPDLAYTSFNAEKLLLGEPGFKLTGCEVTGCQKQ